MLEEPAEKFHDIKVRGAKADTAHFPRGDGDGAVLQADETAVGDGDLENIWGQGGEGGVAVVVGLTVDVPRDGPHLGIDMLEQSSVAHVFFEDGAGEGGEGFTRDKEVGAGGPPGRAVRGEAPAGHNRMDVRVVLEWPAPGMQDPREPREVRPDETCVFGELCEGFSRGVEHGVIREALLRAEKGTQGLRDSEGEEEVRPRELLVQR